MRPVFICFIALWFAGCLADLNAQSPDNEPDPTHWITYAQSYFKLPIAENGIYRITTTELTQAGVPVGQINPTTLQLYHRGIEQAIYVEGEADGRFDPTDFLEFYGQRNDGAPDSLLYHPHNAQPHSYYSLFNDTTAYFLTWRLDGQPGKRMTSYTDTTSAMLLPEPYHWAEEIRLFTDNYPGWAAGLPQKTEYSFYETGEGYTGPIQQKDKPYNHTFQLTNPVRVGPSPKVKVLLVGRESTNHQVSYLAGPSLTNRQRLDSVRFTGYTNALIRHDANWQAIGPDGQLIVSTVSNGEATNTDAYSVSYIQLRYPQQLTAHGQVQGSFHLVKNSAGRSLLAVTDVRPNTRFWDLSDPATPVRIGMTSTNPDTARLVVRNTQVERTIFFTSQPKTVPVIRPVSFVDWRNRKPTYLIISHEALMQPLSNTALAGTTNAIQEYARYRASATGGGYDTLTATMQQLFDQYSYGERHPLAIRRFARQMLLQSSGPAPYLLLLGRSRSTPGIRNDPQQATLDLVMTAGFPGSDGTFTASLAIAEPEVPALPTGRINAGTSQEVIAYLSKVKEYENPANLGLWRKNILHLSGGQSAGERDLLRRLLDGYQRQVTGPFLGARVTTFSKATDNLVEPLPVAKPINEGVGLITFFGHSGLDVTDLDIGFCTNDALGYHNAGHYPLLLVNGCAIGNFFFGRPTLTTDWVLASNRGAIAAIAQSHLGYTDAMHDYTATFYRLLADSAQLDKSIGQLQQETIRRVLASTPDGQPLANSQQMVLQGDPAIRPFPFRTPDYALSSGAITIQDSDHQPLTALSDSVQLRVVVQNAGQVRPGVLPMRVRRLVNGQESGVFNQTLSLAITYQDTLTLTFPNDHLAEGQHLFDVTINPTGLPTTQAEINHTNNQATIERMITGQQPTLIYPPMGGVLKTTAVRLTAQYVANGAHAFDLELDSTARFTSPFRQTWHRTGSNGISYQTTLPNRPNTTYYWRVRLADKPDSAGHWATGSFVYAPARLAPGLPEGQLRLAGTLPADNQQGDVLSIPLQFVNLSPYPFADSVLVVQQTVYAASLANPQTTQWTIKAPMGIDTVAFVSTISTKTLPGTNRIVLTVNPRIQPESTFLNNTLDLPLFVQPDTFGPLLDIAFDGAHIKDGAVVSARPLIDILVADENRSLIRQDTTGLAFYLQRLGRNIPFERLNWQKATIQPTGADKVFRIRYPLPPLVEGTYQLLVTAQDGVGNPAVPYQVHFRVVNEHQLTTLQVYPNPAQAPIRFAFTLTGAQAPATVTLLLTDLAGRRVRHLSPAVRIGLNEWVWDGRSDSGAPIPTGTYVYTLVIADPTEWPVAPSLAPRLSGRIILIH